MLRIAYWVLRILLTDDVFGAVGKGLVDEVVAVVNSTFNSYEDITVTDGTRIDTNTRRVV
ncbi:hypothetical protein ES703_123396 [subsurface metagenome]